jgi:hypothetical protein
MSETIYGHWYTFCDSNLISCSGKLITEFIVNRVLTENEIKNYYCILILEGTVKRNI